MQYTDTITVLKIYYFYLTFPDLRITKYYFILGHFVLLNWNKENLNLAFS